jgi:hypothetical protein
MRSHARAHAASKRVQTPCGRVQEVVLLDQRRAAWEAGQAAWRGLRTRHAVKVFCRRLQSPEFAEPPARLELYSKAR